MSETIDDDTGEVNANGIGLGHRVATAAAQAHVIMKNQLNGLHASSLHFAIWQSLQQMPVWITTDKSGAHKIKYATLKAILEVVRPILLANGVRIRQGAERTFSTDDGGGMKGRLVPVYTDLIHIPTGDFERTMIEIPLMKMDAQAMGSAITYGRRYTLIAALGLATDEADDDGEASKLRDMTKKAEDTELLITLKAECSECKTLIALNKWSADGKTQSRKEKLDEAELDRLRTHYIATRETLTNAV